MGSVYLARDLDLDRDVAIKFIAADRAADPAAQRRFVHEARAAAALDHPNICTVHDVIVEADGRACIVMQYVEGEPLSARLRRGPLEPRQAFSIAADMAAALAAAHKRGIIHRDIKPQNIMITPSGKAKLLDFGIARLDDPAPIGDSATTVTSLTGPGRALGTPTYMSPEQVQQQPLDGRSDLFSLGSVLYESLTGRRPFEAPTDAGTYVQILHEHPPPVSSLREGLGETEDELCRRLLAKHPDDRFASAAELLGALRVLAPDTAQAPGTTQPSRRRPVRGSRGRRRVVASIAVVATVIAALALWLWANREPPFLGQILVADFEDRAGDPLLAKTIRDNLVVKLQQSRSLQVVSSEQIMDALRRMARGGGETVLDVATAAELCERDAIPLLLSGTVFSGGDATRRIAVTGIEPNSRTIRFTETTEFGSDDDLFKALDQLASRVRRQLGESLIGIARSDTPLAAVTTASPAALKLYTRAHGLYAANQADAALPLLREALAIDPRFAMAHRLMARVYETTGNGAQALDHLARAYEFRSGLTEKERYHVEASYFKGNGEYEKAVSTLTAATSLYPADGELRYELALAARDQGDTARAIEHLEIILSRAPLTTAAYSDLVLLRARADQYELARAVYQKARERNVTGAKLEWAHAMLLLGEGRTAEARTVLDGIKRAGVYGGTARLYLAATDILEGKLEAASRQLESDLLLDRSEKNEQAEFTRRTLLARVLILRGRRAEAQKQIGMMFEALGKQPPGRWLHERLVTGGLLAELGDHQRARVVLRQLEQSRASSFAENCYYGLMGEIALAEGRAAEASVAFSTAAARYPRAITTHALARAHAAGKDWRSARDAWSRFVASKGDALREHLAAEWVLAHLHLARASRAAGDLSAAREQYDRFLALWKGGDGLPIIEAAAAERREL
jgi:serine/threonine protein kinase/tetratricopeptide (TPR) repeat protein